MLATVQGTDLMIAAEPSDVFAGEVFAQRLRTEPGCGDVLDCGTVQIKGRTRRLCIRLDTRPDLAAKVEEWQRAVAAEERRKSEAEQAARERVENGEVPIQLHFCDGEYLSGYRAHGYEADLLVAIGAATYVAGWGAHVPAALVNALGEVFSYPAAVEYMRPQQEVAGEAQRVSDAQVSAVERRAAETGKRQVLRRWITAECKNGRDQECSFDAAVEWICPDGSRETTYTCCY